MKKFLEKRLEKASADYYSGNPSMSDDEFDALARAVNFKQGGTREGRVPHAYQMYSLQKIFEGEECPFASDDVIVTPKLDGSAISILYIEICIYIQILYVQIHGQLFMYMCFKTRVSSLEPR